jgi:hypothetical protein
MNVRTVDARSYGRGEDLERMWQQATEALIYFVNYCHQGGLAAKAYLSLGTDPIEELTKLAEKIYVEFLHSIFFTSKLIFERENWHIRQLQSEGTHHAVPVASAEHADGDPADEIVMSNPMAGGRQAEERPGSARQIGSPVSLWKPAIS